jgi:DNA-binding response OmpR family regulator
LGTVSANFPEKGHALRILLIEDDEDIREATAWLLQKQKYTVDTADNGIDALALLLTGIYDMAVVDWMLPGKDGVSVIREARSAGITTPALILTAKTAIGDRVCGLDAGADDYLMKPFASEELFARIRALARRRSDSVFSDMVTFGDLQYRPTENEITCHGETVRLTQKENQLLELLLRNANRVLSKEMLLDRIWGLDTDSELNSVEIYVHYLRKKLSSLDTKVTLTTIRGIGYRLDMGK